MRHHEHITPSKNRYGQPDRDDHWDTRAACTTDPDAFVVTTSTDKISPTVGEALATCRDHCPVLTQCRRDNPTSKGMVIGGRAFNDLGELIYDVLAAPTRPATQAAVRTWAAVNGHDLPEGGYIPKAVTRAYDAACQQVPA